MIASFPKDGSLTQFQELIYQIYGEPDDKLFSVSDLVSNQERFTMRALKGIRKCDDKKLKINLVIAISWMMALANRLHIDVERAVWERFPMQCAYCGKTPCACRKIKPTKRAKAIRNSAQKPGSVAGFQEMFANIYPSHTRTLEHAGVHLAEEMGELSESIHIYLGQHTAIVYLSIKEEIADYVSCIFGVANSAKFDLASQITKIYHHNCHNCHKLPCSCNFANVAKFRS